VKGKGWLCAKELRVGDLLATHDGEWVIVEVIEATGEVVTVYNVSVEDYHTYFVGCEAWGFAVWAHNADYESFFNGQGYGIRPMGGGDRVAMNAKTGRVIGTFSTFAELESALANANLRTVPRSQVAAFQREVEVFKNVAIPESVAANTLPRSADEIRRSLPVWREGDRAQGILVVNDRAYRLTSVRPSQGEATRVSQDAVQLGVGFTNSNGTHLEAQAAAVIRRLEIEGADVSSARLYMNRGFVCARDGVGCAPNLSRMLPEGTTLEVFGSTAGQRGTENFPSFFQRFQGISQ
jgi:Pretoxin HINT domain/SCP1.201-like deaminase